MPSSSSYLKGSLESYTPQKILVLNDYSFCFTRTHYISLRQMLTHGFLCVKYNLFHCTLTKPIEFSRGSYDDTFLPLLVSPYCGSVWMREKSLSSFKKHILIQVTRTHNIQLSILHFYFFLARPMACHQHGILLSYTKYKSEPYCGARIPWSIITEGNALVVHLTITEYKRYALQFFYSSFHTNWISAITSVLHIYNDGFGIVRTYSTKFKSYEFYVMSHPDNYLEIRVISKTNFKGHFFTIRDGPGSLSPIIFEYEDLQTTETIIKTSAFWAFIQIILFDFDMSSYLPFQIRIAQSIRSFPLCTKEDINVIVAKSIFWKNTVCMETFYFEKRYLTLNVETFLFSGPNKVTDLSASVCQYGGLLVQFNGRLKEYGLCEPLHDHVFYIGNNSFNLILVWFKVYSRGLFNGFIGESDCKAYYPEFDMLANQPMYRNYEPISKHGCTIFLSPSPIAEKQSPFNITFGPPAIGSTVLAFIHLNTRLSLCEPEYSYEEHDQNVIIVETVSSDNWPLNVGSLVNYTQIQFSSDVHRNFRFEYLENAKISLPYTCNPAFRRLQLAVVIQVSTCVLTRGHERELVMNKIPSLADTCQLATYLFTPTGVTRKSYMNFIHTDKGYQTIGGEIYVNYRQCPVECQNYRYSIFVKREDEETVLEYTTRVGQATYVGHYHRGFKVTILKPDKLCHQHMECVLELLTSNLDNKPEDHPTLRFYKKR